MVQIAGSAESEFADAAKQGLTPEVDFYIGRNIILFGYHIHHFYFGILLLAIAGWIAIVGSKHFSREHAALCYGAGLGLFMDEIGLLLTWGDYYSSLTYLLSLFLAGILLNIVFFPYFWKDVKNNLIASRPDSSFWNRAFKNHKVIEVVDNMSEKTEQSTKASLVFSGIVYIAMGGLILIFPEFVYYWIAGGFFLQGIASFVNAWQQKESN
ncbi:hypothetical protein Nther_2770 [Natranaerobius thermophilus JW/NM-WN-LF]|uniref:Uncharacterized protein n=2 Tax=Natranaerobius TaxID=375928 RepID=B2A2V2_NATTJ|nr:hypothetical protein Nther_2770 [Natranaerobius thermophilus JW/NM-WN-LF]